MSGDVSALHPKPMLTQQLEMQELEPEETTEVPDTCSSLPGPSSRRKSILQSQLCGHMGRGEFLTRAPLSYMLISH